MIKPQKCLKIPANIKPVIDTTHKNHIRKLHKRVTNIIINTDKKSCSSNLIHLHTIGSTAGFMYQNLYYFTEIQEQRYNEIIYIYLKLT